MPKDISSIISETVCIDDFRDAVIKLNGDFSISCDDMIEMGKSYFAKYPDSYFDRDPEEVRIGYQMARICIVEKLILNAPAEYRGFFRVMFFDVEKIETEVTRLVLLMGPVHLEESFRKMTLDLYSIKNMIDFLPTGMTKERFVGGVTNLYNLAYLIMTAIQKVIKSAGLSSGES
jgi:hypothetical protein